MNSTPQEMLKKAADATVEIKTLEGTKKYAFQLLTRRDAAEVFHNSIQTILKAIAGVDLGAMQKGDVSVDSLVKGLSSVDFDTVWGLGEKLLRFVQIDGEEIADINESDYFGENPEELYLAIVYAVKVNYPKVFSKLRKALQGFGLAEMLKKADPDLPTTA
jgi:hypothetical protein